MRDRVSMRASVCVCVRVRVCVCVCVCVCVLFLRSSLVDDLLRTGQRCQLVQALIRNLIAKASVLRVIRPDHSPPVAAHSFQRCWAHWIWQPLSCGYECAASSGSTPSSDYAQLGSHPERNRLRMSATVLGQCLLVVTAVL